jgi:hypothetical protein
MKLNDHFGSLSEHREKVIIVVITSLISSDNYNAYENNMKDKSKHLLK